jgi:hypothetical protein
MISSEELNTDSAKDIPFDDDINQAILDGLNAFMS